MGRVREEMWEDEGGLWRESDASDHVSTQVETSGERAVEALLFVMSFIICQSFIAIQP